MHARRHWTAFGLVLTLGSAGALAQAQNLPLKVGAANATDHAAAFIAVERGIFARHGLDARLVMYQTGVEMINGLLNGAQDVNIMGSIPFLVYASSHQERIWATLGWSSNVPPV